MIWCSCTEYVFFPVEPNNQNKCVFASCCVYCDCALSVYTHINLMHDVHKLLMPNVCFTHTPSVVQKQHGLSVLHLWETDTTNTISPSSIRYVDVKSKLIEIANEVRVKQTWTSFSDTRLESWLDFDTVKWTNAH